MTRADVGEYCLTPEATTTFDNTTLLLSTGGPGGGGTPGIAIWAGYCSSDALELKVETSTLSGVPSNSIPWCIASTSPRDALAKTSGPSAPVRFSAAAGTSPTEGSGAVLWAVALTRRQGRTS